MSPLRFRPDGLRLPWPALAAFAIVAYAVRSWMRGWDFVPDLTDVLVFGAFAAILIARPLADMAFREEDEDEEEPWSDPET